MAASARETQAVNEVFPVPPLPDTTAMFLPMASPPFVFWVVFHVFV